MIRFSKSSCWELFVTLSHSNIISFHCPKFDKFLKTQSFNPWCTPCHYTNSMWKLNLNINSKSTFTNSVVTTTVGSPGLNLTWQLRNYGEASALSELLLHPSMTHGNDWHSYVACVYHNSNRGTEHTMDWMDEDADSHPQLKIHSVNHRINADLKSFLKMIWLWISGCGQQ